MSIIKPVQGEVWFVNLDPIPGRDQTTKRPCLVISSTLFNQGPADLAIIVPLTTKNSHNPLHIQINPPEGGITTSSFIMCEQIHSVSLQRFLGQSLGIVSTLTLEAVQETLKILINIT